MERIREGAPAPVRHGALDTLSELSLVREAGERLPSSLQLKTRLSVFLVVMLAAVTIPIVLAARGDDDGWRDRVLAVAGLSAMLAVGVALSFVRFYFGPVLRFADNTRRKLQNLTATLEQRVEERTAELVEANGQLRRTLEQNRSIHGQLMDASRRAGMAEVATSVLHNVGNVLNSANVSAGVVIDTVQRSRLAGLGKAAELIREHEADWAQFLSEDDKGRKLPAYICTLAEAAASERALMLDELASLQRNIDHIKTIISRQQSQAKATLGVVEPVTISELVDQVLHDVGKALERERIEVRRDYQPLPVLRLDRHKLIEIVTNLVSNARQALSGCEDRRIAVSLAEAGDERFVIEVADSGCGIPAANLAKIFTFGFTTRDGGHGFGLHASALAAAEMGGKLTAHSAGPGRGARFVLELPRRPPVGYTGSSSDSLDIRGISPNGSP
jgi:signal transduction histidine kinase